MVWCGVVWCGVLCSFVVIYNYLMQVFFTEEKRGAAAAGVSCFPVTFGFLTSCPGRCGVMKGVRDSWTDRDAWYCRRDPFVGSE